MTLRAGARERIRASVVCLHAKHHAGDSGDELGEPELLCVRLRDPMSGVARLFPPGGAIEPGESAREAAEREALEETGYRVSIGPEPERIARYPYTWNGVARDVTTHFFRARLIGDRHSAEPVHDASYHEAVVWLPLGAIDRELGFEPAILEAVRALIAL